MAWNVSLGKIRKLSTNCGIAERFNAAFATSLLSMPGWSFQALVLFALTSFLLRKQRFSLLVCCSFANGVDVSPQGSSRMECHKSMSAKSLCPHDCQTTFATWELRLLGPVGREPLRLPAAPRPRASCCPLAVPSGSGQTNHLESV